MKIHIDARSLSVACSRLQNIVSEKNIAYIGIKATDNKVQLTATDKIVYVYSTHEAQVDEPGICFVSSKIFLSLVKEAPQLILTLSSQEKFLEFKSVSTTSFQFKIPAIESDVWEEPENIDETKKAVVSSYNLKYLVDQVGFIVDKSCPRTYGRVAYFQKMDQKFRFVGTDGYRLSYAEVDYLECSDSFLPAGGGITLSDRTMQEIAKMSQEGFEKVELYFTQGSNCMVARVQDYEIYSKLSLISFPDYTKVITNQFAHKNIFNRKTLQEIVSRIVLAADKTNILRFIFSKNTLTINSNTAGSSEGREELPIEYEGEELKIVINGIYLREVLNVIQTENVSVEFNQPSSPIMVKPVGQKEGLSCEHIIVPINERA